MKKDFNRALMYCFELLKKFDIDSCEWVLVGPHADLLNGYSIRYDRLTHFHVLIEKKKIPWKISKEQKNIIEIIPPLNSEFRKSYEQYMDETGYDFDIILAPKTIMNYSKEIIEERLLSGIFFRRMKPLGNVEISEYIFSQFSPDKLQRQDIIEYIEVIVREAKKLKNKELIKRTDKFAKDILERQKVAKTVQKNTVRDGFLKGEVVFKGKIKGIVQLIKDVEKNSKLKFTEIVVTPRISPKILPSISKAKAWVVDEGGKLSHAAVVARELKKPCVIGTKIATKILKDGDLVEVDAEKGIVRILKRA
ncbi:MAG: PEP-utilizing enzyme [Patescibacteria group bacterium]